MKLRYWSLVASVGLALSVVLYAAAGGTKIATSGTLPASCTVGNVYVKTGASAGLYTCLTADTWTATGGSSGGLVLVEQHTASASASLAFTSCITSTYDTYQIILVDMLPATDNVIPQVQFSTDGGATYDTGGNYATVYFRYSPTGTSTSGASNETEIQVSGGLSLANAATNQGLSGTYYFVNPLGTSGWKKWYGQTDWYYPGTPELLGAVISNAYKSATAVNAFKLYMSSGNIASGTGRCYGLAK